MSPIITIIIPAYNRAETLPRTLRSLAAQTAAPSLFRIILVDNASTDTTPAVMKQWADNVTPAGFDITILSEPAKGAAAARNSGLRHVNTPYVMFFDSDDEMAPHHIASILHSIHCNPDAALFYWDIAIIDRDGWMNHKSQRHPNLLYSHLLHATLSTQRWCALTSLVREVGAWNENLSTWDDLELGTRLLLTAPATVKINSSSPAVLVHTTDNSLTGNLHSERFTHHCRALDAISSSLHPTSETNAKLLLRARRIIYGALYRREGHRDVSRLAYDEALRSLPFTTRFKLHLIYLVTLLTGTGGSSLAPILLLHNKKEK